MEVTETTHHEAFETNTEYRVSTKEKILYLMNHCSIDYVWCASEFCEFFDCKLTTVRPRLSELKAEGKIEAVGITNDYGIREATYRIRKDDEIA